MNPTQIQTTTIRTTIYQAVDEVVTQTMMTVRMVVLVQANDNERIK